MDGWLDVHPGLLIAVICAGIILAMFIGLCVHAILFEGPLTLRQEDNTDAQESNSTNRDFDQDCETRDPPGT